MTDVLSKRCSKCGATKPLSEFYKNCKSPDNHRPDCKACEGKPVATRIARFWRYVHVAGPDDCWLWTGGTATNNGYGRFWLGNRNHAVAHRFSYELANGPIPDGLEVCHSCDTPACVNPHHLFLATHQENMRDMMRKGRWVKPDCSAQVRKLVPDQVKEIRHKIEAGQSTQTVAAEYGVSRNHISAIVRGYRWGGVE